MKENSINIFNSEFTCLKNLGNGGAIYIENDYADLYVTSSIFNYCYLPYSSQTEGGAIYFSTKYGHFEGSKLCASHCSAYLRTFIHCFSTYESKETTTFKMSSYHRCANSSEFGYSNIAYFGSDKAESSDVNATCNIIAKNVVIGFNTKTSTFSSFSIYENNTADALFCFWYTIGELHLTTSVFLESKKISSIYSLIHYNSLSGNTALVSNCSFFNNYSPLFKYYNKAIYMRDCICDEFIVEGSIQTTNIQTTSSFSFVMFSHSCMKSEKYCICTNALSRSEYCNVFMFLMTLIS
jgi:hypothetical protein